MPLLLISIVLPLKPLFVLPDFSFLRSNVDEEAEWKESVGETAISGDSDDEVWKTRCCGRESVLDFAGSEDVIMKEFPRVTLVVVKVVELYGSWLLSFDVDGFNAQTLLTKFIMWLRCFRLVQNKKNSCKFFSFVTFSFYVLSVDVTKFYFKCVGRLLIYVLSVCCTCELLIESK